MNKRQAIGKLDINAVSYPNIFDFVSDLPCFQIDPDIIYDLNQKHILHEAYLQ